MPFQDSSIRDDPVTKISKYLYSPSAPNASRSSATVSNVYIDGFSRSTPAFRISFNDMQDDLMNYTVSTIPNVGSDNIMYLALATNWPSHQMETT